MSSAVCLFKMQQRLIHAAVYTIWHKSKMKQFMIDVKLPEEQRLM